MYEVCSKCKKRKDLGQHKVCLECREKNKLYRTNLKESAIETYGGKCTVCGESNLTFLCIDHISGDGAEHRRMFNGHGGGVQMYLWLRDNGYPPGFQTMCFNCNHKKAFHTLKPDLITKATGIDKTCRRCGQTKDSSLFSKTKGKEGICNLCMRKSRRMKDKALTLKVYNAYGGAKCSCCGEETYEYLTLDHIPGGGTQHRKAMGFGSRDLKYWLVKNNFPEGYRVLCMNCNFALGHFGECPHQLEEHKEEIWDRMTPYLVGGLVSLEVSTIISTIVGHTATSKT